MKLEEIRKYKIVDNVMLAGQSEIPTLDDMLEILEKEEFSDKLMILEIKDNSLEMPDKIAEVIDKHPDVRNRLLFIAFSENVLPDLAEKMPDIPRGFLDSLSTDDFLRRMSPVNAFMLFCMKMYMKHFFQLLQSSEIRDLTIHVFVF